MAKKGVKKRKILKIALVRGQVVSVDQLVIPTPGFVPTHRGTPTTNCYIGATVFVDHFSNFTYAHLMTKMNAEATVEAKLAFERVYNAMASESHITMQTTACLTLRPSRRPLLRPNRPCHFAELMLIIKKGRHSKGLRMSLKARALLFCMQLIYGRRP